MKNRVKPLLVLSAILLSGCVFAPGTGNWDDDTGRRVRPTVGQELLDLDRAHAAGVISDVEFERVKERLLDR